VAEARGNLTGLTASALRRPATVLGGVCAALLPLVTLDMAVRLPYMPEAWWRPVGEVPLPPGHFDVRMMVICPDMPGWLGLWGYLFALVWIPLASYRTWRAIRAGVEFRPHERILLLLIPTLIVMIELTHHLTPLKDGYPLL